jgi:hypothetical protein
MRLLLGFFILIVFCSTIVAQKQLNTNDLILKNRSVELGMPFSTYAANQQFLEQETVLINIVPSHVFSCFGVGWEASDNSLDPALFKVSYRTLEPSGIWSEWIEMEGEISPDETPTEKYWTEAIFTHNAESHLELELSLTVPVATIGLQIDLFDGNFKSAEDFSIKDTPQSPDSQKGARNCPQFPTMITRAEWCGGSATCSQVLTPYTPTYISPTHIVIHHGASPNTYTDGQAVVRSYYNYHVNTLGWIDIGYNYIVDKYGNFFQGRHNPNLPTTDVRGAHAGAANSGSIGVNYPGNLDVELATPIQMQRVSELLAWWFDHKAYDPLSSESMQTQAYGVQVQPRITGHRDIGSTACPGNDLHSRLPDLRNMTNQIIDDCNNVITDVDAPETVVQATYDWRGYDFWAEFNDSDNPGGSGVDEQYYQVLDFDGTEWRANHQNGFFNDNFNTTIHPDWVTQDGAWSINTGSLFQSDEAVGNTNIYAPLTQNNQQSYLYQWSGIIAGTGTNRRSGLHFFVDDPTLPNRGNSYLAWFRADDNAFHFYKIENDVLNLVVNEPYTINTNTWYDFKVTFNPQTGVVEAFVNDDRVASYTDASPLTAGGYISLRNGDSEAYFDDLKVRTSRSFQEKITVGPLAANDARYESPITTQDACRINSIVKDAAGNWSAQNARQIYVDWTLPTTSSTTTSSWQIEDFTVDFTDEDNVDGSGIARRFYQIIDFDGTDWRANAERGFFSDNFDQTTGIHPEWTVVNGSWNNTNGHLEQTDDAPGNTNIYAFLKQDLSNRYLYNFQFKLDGAGNNKRGGFHYFCDDPTATNRGNSYFVWFRQEFQTLEFYRVSNDTFSQEKVYPIEFQQNQWLDVKIIYDRITGETLVYMNDKLVGDWKDDNPIQTGDYISFRSGNSIMSVNNLKVYRTRFPQATITLGAPTADIRYENTDPATFSAKVKSIVHDEAHNLSEIYYHDLNVDWTPPIDLNIVLDGLAADIDTFYTANEISANWDAAIDVNSGISHYLMSIGTSLGATDVVAWTTVGNVTSHTLTGLSLFGGVTYYINIKAVNGANLESSVVSSDGQYLDVDASLAENEQVPFNLFPNPIKDEVQLQVSGTIKEFDATLYAMNGQIVWKQNSIQNTNGLITIPIQSSIVAGMYVFEMRNGEQSWEVKVIKE